MRTSFLISACLLATLGSLAAHAQGSRVYRCGNAYTNDAQDAAARNCKPIEGGNVTIIQGRPPAAASPASPAPRASQPASSAPRIDSGIQLSRDQEARRILQGELEKSRERLQQLQGEYKNGTPDRLGSERNYQRYLDRVGQLGADIERTQADIDGIQREISRLPSSAATPR